MSLRRSIQARYHLYTHNQCQYPLTHTQIHPYILLGCYWQLEYCTFQCRWIVAVRHMQQYEVAKKGLVAHGKEFGGWIVGEQAQ